MTKEDFQKLFLDKVSTIKIPLTLVGEGFNEEGSYIYSSNLKISHPFNTNYYYTLEVEYLSESDYDYPCCCLFSFCRGAGVFIHVRVQIHTLDEVTLFLDYILKACEIHYDYDVVIRKMDELRKLPPEFMREKFLDAILKDLENEI